MSGQDLYIVAADGDEEFAEKLARPLREAGYEVVHNGTIQIGESKVAEATKALDRDLPVVLCATAKAAGTTWTHQIVNAARVGVPRVFVVQMEREAYVDHLAVRTKVAQYWDDPAQALKDLVQALGRNFPPLLVSPSSELPAQPLQVPVGSQVGSQFLDELTDTAAFDVDALQEFRDSVRKEVAARYPPTQTPWEFLSAASLWADGRLTRTGALLFARNPTSASPTSMVKCTQYFGPDRSAERDAVTFEGTVPTQIVAARQFVADRVRRGEAPSPNSAESAVTYDYPMIAVREIIANALVHRDYTSMDSCVHVRIFSDRLEVSSPGTWLGRELPAGIEHDLTQLEGQSIKRNFRLAHVLSWAKLVEGEGSGIPSALRDCRTAGVKSPTVTQEHGFVTVTVRHRQVGDAKTALAGRDTLSMVLPATLPTDTPRFAGRDAELNSLDRLLESTEGGESSAVVVSAISGIGGVGKTALAVHWAHRVRERFPDGQLYANLRGFAPHGTPAQPEDVLRGFLDALGVPSDRIPVDLDSRAALYRSLLASRRVLVMLDDAANEQDVVPLLPAAPGCMVLITSRIGLSGLVARQVATTLTLNVLTLDDAVGLLANRLGSERVAAEREAAVRLVEYCGHLPLALAIVAARAAARPSLTLQMLADGLVHERDREAELLGSHQTTSLLPIFASSYRALSSEARRLFRLLGLHAGPSIDRNAAANLVALSPQRTAGLLDELVEAHLLAVDATGRLQLHDLLRLYARGRADAEERSEESHLAVERVIKYYLHTAAAADRWLDANWEADASDPPPGDMTVRLVDSYDAAMAWFTEEQAVLLSAIRQAAELGFDQYAYQLAWSLATFLYRRGHWREWASIHEVAAEATRRLGDPHAEARTRRILGSAYSRLRRYDEALANHQRALTIFRQLGDATGQAHTHLMLGRLFDWQGRHNEALQETEAALGLYWSAGMNAWVARAENDLGRVYNRLGSYQAAVDHCRKALLLSRQLGDRDGEAAALDSLGGALHALGMYGDAISHFRQALALRREIGDHYEETETLSHLGDALKMIGHKTGAQAAWQQALSILEQLDHPDADGVRARLSIEAMDETGQVVPDNSF